jgi:hypothetical protein
MYGRGCCEGAESFVFLIDPGAIKLTIRRSPAYSSPAESESHCHAASVHLLARRVALSFYGMTFIELILQLRGRNY